MLIESEEGKTETAIQKKREQRGRVNQGFRQWKSAFEGDIRSWELWNRSSLSTWRWGSAKAVMGDTLLYMTLHGYGWCLSTSSCFFKWTVESSSQTGLFGHFYLLEERSFLCTFCAIMFVDHMLKQHYVLLRSFSGLSLVCSFNRQV